MPLDFIASVGEVFATVNREESPFVVSRVSPKKLMAGRYFVGLVLKQSCYKTKKRVFRPSLICKNSFVPSAPNVVGVMTSSMAVVVLGLHRGVCCPSLYISYILYYFRN